MNDIQLKKRIMRRVYAAWTLRQITSAPLVKLYIIVALVWQSSQYISAGHVFANSPGLSELSAYYTFFASAFSNTETSAQFLLVGTVALALWFARDIIARFLHPTPKLVSR